MEVLNMRATLNIPDDLLSEVQKISGEKSKTKAITIAMQEYIRQKKIKELIALKGRIQIDYDWEKEEELEMKVQKKREKILEK
jgi:metal-responsive CopG/Arc/MetJ family transcriptional regulator